ncbi:hypothetical protein AYI68_g4870 [Smittium mucronatum]|uniref:Uncharacterized protein n=1 Tax=Smittium mucronatum TaxID=133383 RepID=A0A1R0GW02_9FUNG|nr:hypothetical protein AYI68_g4870 [Smittium mucronatum]
MNKFSEEPKPLKDSKSVIKDHALKIKLAEEALANLLEQVKNLHVSVTEKNYEDPKYLLYKVAAGDNVKTIKKSPQRCNKLTRKLLPCKNYASEYGSCHFHYTNEERILHEEMKKVKNFTEFKYIEDSRLKKESKTF